MADRTTITKVVAPGAYSGAGVVFTGTAADVTNKNRVVLTGNGREILIAENTDVGAQNVTITSVDDSFGRTEDITHSMAASEKRVFGPFEFTGWAQANNELFFEAADANVEFTVITLF